MKGNAPNGVMRKAARDNKALFALNTPTKKPKKKPNIVMLMTDDTGWNDFGCYSLGARA